MIEIAAIFRQYIHRYYHLYGSRIPKNHRKAIHAIMRCRTAQSGGTTWYCKKCDEYIYSYHSCGNRNCNKCQGGQVAAEWFEKASTKLLPTHHFLVTFTLPGIIRKTVRSQQRLFYDLIFKAASQAMQQLAYDTRFCGGRLGMLGVLHTWGRNICYHPHVHFIVSGGGLFEDEGFWLASKEEFFVPVKALSLLFRAKFRDMLKQQDSAVYDSVIKSCPGLWRRKWVVHSQPAGKGSAALKYLAAYVFRPAITNNNIIALKDDKVTFRYRDHITKQYRTCTVDVMDFMHRYLQHVLPKGFVKVRYMGLYANACKQKHTQALMCLNSADKAPENKKTNEDIYFSGDVAQDLNREKGQKPKHPCCPRCKGLLIFIKNNARCFYYPHAPPQKKSQKQKAMLLIQA